MDADEPSVDPVEIEVAGGLSCARRSRETVERTLMPLVPLKRSTRIFVTVDGDHLVMGAEAAGIEAVDSPLSAVLEVATAKVLHGAVRLR